MSDKAEEGDGFEFAVVEIFGHRRHAGRIREEERFGAKMLRLDVPVDGESAPERWVTHWYGGAAIFSITLTDRESVMRANRHFWPGRITYKDEESDSEAPERMFDEGNEA